jgi:hypothetical protein
LFPKRQFNSKTVDILKREKIKDLHLDSFYIDGPLDLGALRLLPELASFSLRTEKSVDWSFVLSLKRLERIALISRWYTPAPLDFSSFPRLQTANLTWYSEWESILTCKTLQGLMLEDSKKLKELDLRGLPRVSEVQIARCNQLQRIVLSPDQSIKSLGIYGCRSFQGVEPFGAMQSLRYLCLSGNSKFEITSIRNLPELIRLSMMGVGRFPNLNFLSKCVKLERLAMHFSTQVEDGDLTVLTKLPIKQVSFRRYKNYTHTLDEIKACHRIVT